MCLLFQGGYKVSIVDGYPLFPEAPDLKRCRSLILEPFRCLIGGNYPPQMFRVRFAVMCPFLDDDLRNHP